MRILIATLIALGALSTGLPALASSDMSCNHRLMPACEQRLGNEPLEALHASAERGRGQRQILRGGLNRAQPRDLDERLDSPEWRQPPHDSSPPPLSDSMHVIRIIGRIEAYDCS